MTTLTTHTLDVPGARLHYELRGSGPLVAMIGLPMTSDGFTALADELADGYTVLTYDPRGFGDSAIDDPDEDADPRLLAHDVHLLLDAVTDEPAIVFGSSGGAIVAMALIEAHPEQVRTVVLHEPPVGYLLPEAEQLDADTHEVYATYLSDGPQAAFGRFMALAGFSMPEPDPNAPEPPPMSERDAATGERMLAHSLLPVNDFRADLAALRDSSTRIVIGGGAASVGQLPRRAGDALAAELGIPVTEFPGDHAGFVPMMGGDVPAFATTLRASLD